MMQICKILGRWIFFWPKRMLWVIRYPVYHQDVNIAFIPAPPRPPPSAPTPPTTSTQCLPPCLSRITLAFPSLHELDTSVGTPFPEEVKKMAILADSFLVDVDELSGNEAELIDNDNEEAENMEEDVDPLADIEALNYDDLDSVSKLQKSQRFTYIMQKVEDALEKGSNISDHGIVLENYPEYQQIVDFNGLSVDIENEIVIIHNFIRDKYRLKFLELESLVHHPINYARVVKRIGNEMDLTLVDLEGLLPSGIIMVVSVGASTTSDKQHPEEVLQKTIDACDRALALDSAKKKVLDCRMGYIAPNVSALVGSAVAAKLTGTAGGLSALAKMPSCNVQLLGAKKKNLAGFSTATSQLRVGYIEQGYIEQTEIIQSTPPSLRMRACRLLAAKSTLAARVDSTRGDPTGKHGRSLLKEIRKKIEKWQEPPPAKQPKPLPVPYSEPEMKRGGRRLRKMKERMGDNSGI